MGLESCAGPSSDRVLIILMKMHATSGDDLSFIRGFASYMTVLAVVY